MSPELAWNERAPAEFHEKALGRLPELCRRAYLVVRDEEETYGSAVSRLGAHFGTVRKHTVRAQERIRRERRAREIIGAN